jgi:hypothetical protein
MNRPVKFPLKEVQKMKKWIIPVMVTVIALLMSASAQVVAAQDATGFSLSKSADPTTATIGDTITYTYTITNTNNSTINGISLQDDLLGYIDLGGQTSLDAGGTITATANYTVVESDLPGPLVNTATVSGTNSENNTVTASATATVELNGTASLQVTKSADTSKSAPHNTINYTYTVTNNGSVTISDLTLQDDKLGAISLAAGTLAAGESTTATASYTVTTSDLPGPVVNTATVKGTGPDGQTVTADSESVSVSLSQNRWEWFKCEILKWRGVPGKGIDHAPGLQKPFNPNCQAPENVGKKDRNDDQEQLRIRQQTLNQDDNQGQIKVEQKVKNRR